MFPYTRPFQLIEDLGMVPFRSQVYVVSDETYKKYQEKEAQVEIDKLEARALDYEKTAVLLKEQAYTLRKKAGLLPSSTKSDA